MPSGFEFTPYDAGRRAACLALFDANCPESFAPNERADYQAFLDAPPHGYRVGLLDGRVVAAFGVAMSRPGRCRLSWIMVARDAQGAGIGRRLMTDVVRHAAASGATWVEIAASHKSAPFFARFGARECGRIQDGWGPGMHRIDMELPVSGGHDTDAASAPRSPLFQGPGGQIVVPTPPLVGRLDGGHLIVNPPREVWERSELSNEELTAWSLLVAAAGRAMIDVLPQLAGGCVNYWEAGNWALHDDADPKGAKDPRTHRRVHLHLLGRSRTASHPAWQWGEAPRFPWFADRLAWARDFEPLSRDECDAVVARVDRLLTERNSRA